MTDSLTNEENNPKIEVDSDWKAEAQAEKVRLADAEKKVEQRAEARKMPEADFRGLLGALASQALMGLGMHQDPSGKGVMVDLEGSKFVIDLIGVVEEKTKGNLSEEESNELKQLLTELQSRFVQVAQLVAAQTAEGTATTPEGEHEATPSIIDPTS
ncbi:MAG: DUF1844 domain-containing protein [Phycisphaerales bacterium]|jgi:hypothetical protein|nr:DUF1844 domain-containing protein [Phycisphaerales bacterium]MDP6693190.1 DUF1844 domain-containing protein [Phycisphaerales bacterium]